MKQNERKIETQEEMATRLAREDWNRQCNDFIMGRAQFRDKSLKACRNRILKELLATEQHPKNFLKE